MSCKSLTLGAVLAAAVVSATPASAVITITQGASAPTYTTTLNFDEPGAPTGTDLPSNAFAAYGVSALVSGTGNNFVNDPASMPALAFAGGDNVFYGPFGVFMTLDADVNAFSMQFWDNSGPSTGFGGGAGIFLLNDGEEVASAFFTPAWGGFGDAWFNIVATNGDIFDEVRALGFGFSPESIVDNLSWQSVPAPATGALLTGFGGMAVLRRRRA